MKKIEICFVSLNSLPLLIESKLDYIGGAEVQQYELAKEFLRRKYKVSFITYNEKINTNVQNENEIRIGKVYKRNESSKIFFLRKIILILRKMNDLNPDVFFHRAGCPGIVTFFGKILNKKVIKSVASDAEVVYHLKFNDLDLKNIFLNFARYIDFKFSDIIVCQNIFQKEKLMKRYSKKLRYIPNAYSIPNIPICKKGENILWVGTIKPLKQPEIFLELAEKLPNYNFIMIGGRSRDINFYNQIKKSAKEIKNLDFIGYVPHDRIVDFYKISVLLVNTSKYEGFPNIFLESWIYSLPVISLNVDPSGIISKYELGYKTKNFDELVSKIKNLMQNKKIMDKMAKNARNYVEKNHNIKRIVDIYEKEIMEFLLINKR